MKSFSSGICGICAKRTSKRTENNQTLKYQTAQTAIGMQLARQAKGLSIVTIVYFKSESGEVHNHDNSDYTQTLDLHSTSSLSCLLLQSSSVFRLFRHIGTDSTDSQVIDSKRKSPAVALGWDDLHAAKSRRCIKKIIGKCTASSIGT